MLLIVVIVIFIIFLHQRSYRCMMQTRPDYSDKYDLMDVRFSDMMIPRTEPDIATPNMLNIKE